MLENYQKVIHILSDYLTPERKAKIQRVLDGRTYSVIPVLDRIHDEGNIFAIIRSAENLGFQRIHVISPDKIKRVKGISLGSEKWVDIHRWERSAECLKSLKAQGYKICATNLNGPSLSLSQLDCRGPMAVVFGNERDGVSREVLEAADCHIHIPTLGLSQSLNVSVATAICLYWIQQKRIEVLGKHGDLTFEQKEILKAHFYFKSSKIAPQLLDHFLKSEESEEMLPTLSRKRYNQRLFLTSWKGPMKDKYIQNWMDLYNDQLKVRLQKRNKMEEEKKNPYKNSLKPSTKARALHQQFDHLSKKEIAKAGEGQIFSLAGRVLLVRDFGKAAFASLDDGSAKFQIYIKKGTVAEEGFAEYKYLDYGDIVWAEGEVFRTDKGELSLLAKRFFILTKSLRPLPEKFHGLSDPELKYRLRYVDMIMDPEVRHTLMKRSEVIRFIRDFFYDRGYLEVETPMLHSVAGGALAKPFMTHHNALSMEMFLRIAPELHLKRLIVGGYTKVFEMNRCFRNEGLSLKHNPEFTTIEFYEAYATYKDLMELTEELLNGLAKKVCQGEKVTFGSQEISFARPFKRMTMREAVAQYTGLSLEKTHDSEAMRPLLRKKGLEKDALEGLSTDALMVLCFDHYAEEHLVQPTFITEFPTEISPLSRRNDDNPNIVDRFELFINGWEIANAFSELNNPSDQLERFAEQAVKKESGDEEACEVDYDYVRALEYGLPPTAGEGMGIDRLCMILTNSPSIRDVILFPQLKKENFFQEGAPEE